MRTIIIALCTLVLALSISAPALAGCGPVALHLDDDLADLTAIFAEIDPATGAVVGIGLDGSSSLVAFVVAPGSSVATAVASGLPGDPSSLAASYDPIRRRLVYTNFGQVDAIDMTDGSVTALPGPASVVDLRVDSTGTVYALQTRFAPGTRALTTELLRFDADGTVAPLASDLPATKSPWFSVLDCSRNEYRYRADDGRLVTVDLAPSASRSGVLR